VNEIDGAFAHEPSKGDQGARVRCAPHADADRRYARRFRFTRQGAVRLADDQRTPPVPEEPAALGQDANLLTAEAR
jgi:hypothetical protein